MIKPVFVHEFFLCYYAYYSPLLLNIKFCLCSIVDVVVSIVHAAFYSILSLDALSMPQGKTGNISILFGSFLSCIIIEQHLFPCCFSPLDFRLSGESFLLFYYNVARPRVAWLQVEFSSTILVTDRSTRCCLQKNFQFKPIVFPLLSALRGFVSETNLTDYPARIGLGNESYCAWLVCRS